MKKLAIIAAAALVSLAALAHHPQSPASTPQTRVVCIQGQVPECRKIKIYPKLTPASAQRKH